MIQWDQPGTSGKLRLELRCRCESKLKHWTSDREQNWRPSGTRSWKLKVRTQRSSSAPLLVYEVSVSSTKGIQISRYSIFGLDRNTLYLILRVLLKHWKKWWPWVSTKRDLESKDVHLSRISSTLWKDSNRDQRLKRLSSYIHYFINTCWQILQ